ncbi:hypothetical protein JXO59_16330, partial [candidate division KSB1 bacterium]|nr:hypothetical protein [candidate division KSB1 bacterium]
FFFNDRRRDNYTSEWGDIESLREGAKGVENALIYGITPTLNLRLQNAYMLRNVELVSYSSGASQRRRKRHDEIGDHSLILYWHPQRYYGRLTLSYFSQTQKYDIARSDSHLPFSSRTAFITPDNESNRLFLGVESALPLGRRDSLFYYTSISRFQYDTPDTNNFDDRDELRINSKLVWAHTLRPSLRCEIHASVNFYHMVYIYGERSADNNWNRIIRLRPIVTFAPHRSFKWVQSFEVLANYVDYDFEEMDVRTKSFVFRKFAYDDSMRISFSPRTSALIDYRLQLEENGELFWDAWKERLLTTRTSHWLQVRLSYASSAVLQWSPGYTFYSRDEWRHENESGTLRRRKYQSFSSHGPMIAITYFPSKKIRMTLDAVRRKVLPFQQKTYYINTFDIRVDLLF